METIVAEIGCPPATSKEQQIDLSESARCSGDQMKSPMTEREGWWPLALQAMGNMGSFSKSLMQPLWEMHLGLTGRMASRRSCGRRAGGNWSKLRQTMSWLEVSGWLWVWMGKDGRSHRKKQTPGGLGRAAFEVHRVAQRTDNMALQEW